MMGMHASKIPLLCVALLCSACSFISTRPTDLALRSVEAVDLYEQRAANLPHLIGLKILFETSENLPQLAREKPEMRARTYMCDDPQQKSYEFVGYSPVRLLGLEIDPLATGKERLRGTELDGSDWAIAAVAATTKPHIYYAYAGIAQEMPSYREGVPRMLYDLRKEPRDLCLDVQMIDWQIVFVTRYRSNVIIVPREAVAAALKKLP